MTRSASAPRSSGSRPVAARTAALFVIVGPVLWLGCTVEAPLALASAVRTPWQRPFPGFGGVWEQRSPMPTSRAEVAGAVLDGRIYVAGGLTTLSNALDVVEAYDPASDTWSIVAPLPEARHHPGLAAVGGKLYLTGGYPGSQPPWALSDRVFVYDPASDTWSEGTPMPRPRAAHTSAAVDGRIYLIGGVTPNGLATVDAYDPATGQWEERSPMPTAREHLASAVIDGVIYVVGGRTGANVDALEAYSPAFDSWTVLPAMPTARSGLGAAALNGKLYVFGGEIPATFSENEVFDPIRDEWEAAPGLPTPRHGVAGVSVGDRIYVIGGGPVVGASHSRVNESFYAGLQVRRLEEGLP